MSRKNKKKYCTNESLMCELRHYHETGEMTDELGVMFMDIANRLTGHSYFRYYDRYTKEELISSAILRMVSQIHKFDIERENPNPFAYFTQTAWNAFVRECTGHYNQKNIKRKIAISYFTKMESDPHFKVDPKLFEIMQDMIEEDDHYNKQRLRRLKENSGE